MDQGLFQLGQPLLEGRVKRHRQGHPFAGGDPIPFLVPGHVHPDIDELRPLNSDNDRNTTSRAFLVIWLMTSDIVPPCGLLAGSLMGIDFAYLMDLVNPFFDAAL